jgi:hypothetical protein
MKWAIKLYKENALKNLTEAAVSTRIDGSLSEQVINKISYLIDKKLYLFI